MQPGPTPVPISFCHHWMLEAVNPSPGSALSPSPGSGLAQLWPPWIQEPERTQQGKEQLEDGPGWSLLRWEQLEKGVAHCAGLRLKLVHRAL